MVNKRIGVDRIRINLNVKWYGRFGKIECGSLFRIVIMLVRWSDFVHWLERNLFGITSRDELSFPIDNYYRRYFCVVDECFGESNVADLSQTIKPVLNQRALDVIEVAL